MTAVATVPALNADFATKLRPAVRRTWDMIGGDLEQACSECGEPLENDGAVEAVFDADYMKMYGGDRGESAALVSAAFKQYGYDTMIKWLTSNFRLV